MAEMIDGYVCPECRARHKLPPYHGYRIGVDLGSEGGPVIVVAKQVPDGAGGYLVVILDVVTRPLT